MVERGRHGEISPFYAFFTTSTSTSMGRDRGGAEISVLCRLSVIPTLPLLAYSGVFRYTYRHEPGPGGILRSVAEEGSSASVSLVAPAPLPASSLQGKKIYNDVMG